MQREGVTQYIAIGYEDTGTREGGKDEQRIAEESRTNFREMPMVGRFFVEKDGRYVKLLDIDLMEPSLMGYVNTSKMSDLVSVVQEWYDTKYPPTLSEAAESNLGSESRGRTPDENKKPIDAEDDRGEATPGGDGATGG